MEQIGEPKLKTSKQLGDELIAFGADPKLPLFLSVLALSISNRLDEQEAQIAKLSELASTSLADAARYKELMSQVGGSDGQFTLRYLRPVPGADIMRGSVSEHCENAIDASIVAKLAATYSKDGQSAAVSEQPEEITSAAIQYDGQLHSLPRPNRHLHIHRSIGQISGGHIEGFLTSTGRFVSRAEAWDIAVAGNQLLNMAERASHEFYIKNISKGYLYSEDLWVDPPGNDEAEVGEVPRA
jgi:hypothetical protein